LSCFNDISENNARDELLLVRVWIFGSFSRPGRSGRA
jgi:hypothetical protein